MRFVLLDLTGGATTRDGGKLSPDYLTELAAAYTIQLNRDYSPQYGGNFVVRAGADKTDLQPGENPFAWLPTLADAPGAIAYHSANGNGQPLLFDGINLNDTLSGPGNSADVAGSHELLEAARDPACNQFRDGGAGLEYTDEIADPFESRAYPLKLQSGTTVWLSDFALPSYFTPGAPGPYSFVVQTAQGAGQPDAAGPFQFLPDLGYQMVRSYDAQSLHDLDMDAALLGRVFKFGVSRRRPDAAPHTRKWRRGLR